MGWGKCEILVMLECKVSLLSENIFTEKEEGKQMDSYTLSCQERKIHTQLKE